MASPAQAIRHQLLNTFFSRYSVWFLCIFVSLYLTWIIFFNEGHYIYYFFSDTVLNLAWIISSILAAIGFADIIQTQHSILRNYPLMGHFRFFFEDRPAETQRRGVRFSFFRRGRNSRGRY